MAEPRKTRAASEPRTTLSVELPTGLVRLLETYTRLNGVTTAEVVGGALCDALGVAPYAHLARAIDDADDRAEERANTG
jgi:hypothetical protein